MRFYIFSCSVARFDLLFRFSFPSLLHRPCGKRPSVNALRRPAYLTNPSETSFRAYLTEQSFRQHLSRLDEAAQDDEADARNAGLHFTLSKQSATIAHKSSANFGIQSPFHFVNRASISLRTPKHIIRSFGILTIAAVLPSGSSHTRSTIAVESPTSTVNDSWFIGAFGKWWRGGSIRAWWHNSFVDSKDAERLTSGILDVKTLDNLECYEGKHS